jgi:hypothetical protein
MNKKPTSMKIKTWGGYAVAYLAWIIFLALGVWFAMIARQDFQGLLTTYYVEDSIVRGWQVNFLDKVFLLVIGFAWLVLMIVTEGYFKRGLERKLPDWPQDLAKRIARVLGPEILLIFLADLTLFNLQGFADQPWSRWLVFALEIIFGGVFTWYAISHPAGSIKDQARNDSRLP